MSEKTETKQKDPQDQIKEQLIALKEAIHPKKYTSKYLTFISKPFCTKKIELSLLADHSKQPRSQNLVKKSTIIPLLLYQFFFQKQIQVMFFSQSHFLKKQQEQKSEGCIEEKMTTDSPEQFRDQFFKDKKSKSLLKLIDQVLHASAFEQKRDKDKYQKQKIDFSIGIFQIMINFEEQQSLDELLSLFSSFFCILTSLLQNWSVKLSSLKIKHNANKDKSFKFQKDFFNSFSLNFWKFVASIKKIETLEIKFSKMKQFFNPKMIQLSKNENNELNSSVFESIYRLEIQEIKNEEDELQVSLDYLIPFFRISRNLKSFVYNICWTGQQEDVQFIHKDQIKLFKTISESNFFIENIFFNFKLSYESITKDEMQKQDEKLGMDRSENLDQDQEILDRNLYWLGKMQQNCPYLAGVKFQFDKKSQTEDRRLSENQRQNYLQKLKTTREIMNRFFKKAMNNQTYFNSIKIMEAEDYDFETILGVLERIEPFAPR